MAKQITQLTLAIGLAAIAVLALLIVLARPVTAADQCVVPGGGGGCFATIQAAVDAAGSGDTVRVVAGVYPERVVINKNLTLLGGCATSACTTRNPGASTIHGGGSGTVIRISNGAAVTVDGFTITGGNGTTNNGTGGGISIRQATADIRNNTIMGNVASTNPGLGGVGGGIHVISSTSPVLISGNTIQANVAYSVTSGSQFGFGGGITIDSASSATIAGNQILSNVAAQTQVPSTSAAGYGGGIAVVGDSVLIADNTIQGNLGIATGREGFGGGINIYRTPLVTLTNNIIDQNTAITSGSNAGGGGMHVNTSSSSGARLTLTGNWVTNNTGGVSVSGSDINVHGGGINIFGDGANDTLTVQGNHLIGNVAVRQLTASANGYVSGGGLSASNLTGASIIGNEILSNVGAYTLTVSGGGGSGATGGVNLFDSTALLQGNIVSGNTCRRDEPGEGYAIFVNGGTATMTQNRILGNRSGGVFALISTLTSTNDVIARNTGGGLGAGSIGPPTKVTIINDTFYDNGNVGIEARNPGTTVSVTNTIVYSHEEGLGRNAPAILVGNYNLLSNTLNYAGGAAGGANDILNQNPLFINAANDDFRLAKDSPAIDKGTASGAPGVDFEGEPRPYGPGVDIGADERSPFKIYLPIIQKRS